MKLNAKYVTFTLIGLASLYVLYHNERFLVEPENPVWQRYEAFRWWLLPHGIFGAIVLLFAPLPAKAPAATKLDKIITKDPVPQTR